MNSKTFIKYLLIYITLNFGGIYIASKFWWADSIKLTALSKDMLALIFCASICWIGILYLSILITRKFFIRITSQNFIGPFDLVFNEIYQKEIGLENVRKFKSCFSVVAFSILFLTFIGLITSVKNYENYELTKNGIIETVIVSEIIKNLKSNEYVRFEYGNRRFKTNLPNEKNLLIGDKVNVIYSERNPKIIKYQTEQ